MPKAASPRRRDAGMRSFVKAGPVAFRNSCACVLSKGGSKAVSITREAMCLGLEIGRQFKRVEKSEIIRIHRQLRADWQCLFKEQLQMEKFCGRYPSLWEGSPIHLFTGSLVAAGRPLLNGVHHVGRKASFPQEAHLGNQSQSSLSRIHAPCPLRSWTECDWCIVGSMGVVLCLSSRLPPAVPYLVAFDRTSLSRC